MPNIKSIALLIAAAYTLVLALVIGLGMEAVHSVNKLRSISGDLYNHPFLVSNTALDVQAKIVLMRNDMMGVALYEDPHRIDEVSAQTGKLDGAIRNDFKVIRTAFLGDSGRIDEIDRQLDEWQRLRVQIFELVRNGQRERARQLVTTAGEDVYRKVKSGNDSVVDYAKRQAMSYADTAARESESRIRTIWWLLLGLTALLSFLLIMIGRRILLEFRRSQEFAQALMESEKKFHMLFDSANDCMLLLSADGRIVDINRRGHERLGYTKREMLGRRIADFDSPEYAEQVPQRMARILEKGSAEFESAHVCKDGTVMPIEVSARIVELGGRRHYYSVIRDITERKRFERELSSREAHYRGAIETSSDGFWAADMQGRLLEVNDIYARQSGYSREELLNMSIQQLEAKEKPEETAAHIQKLLQEGYDRFETLHRRKDGSLWPLEIAVSYWPQEGGRFFVFCHDITQRKRFEEQLSTREARYRGAIETSPEGYWRVDMQGRLLEVNDAYVHQSGYSREELLSMTVPQLEAKEKPEETAAHIHNILNEGYDRFETLHRRKDGSIWPVEIAASYWSGEGGCIFTFCRDISERKHQEEEQKLAVMVFQNISEAMSVTDAKNRIIAVNPAFTELTGYAAEEVIGKNPSVLSSGRHDDEFYQQMWRSLEDTGQWQGEIWDRRKDGELMAEWLTISTIYDEDGWVHRRVALFSDITQKKESEETIWRQANFDPLTLLPNRRMFRDRLEQEVRKAHRSETVLGLFFIDLDHFKEINDTLGHHVGDELLVEAGKRIVACVRESDTVARLGGDEFTVILSELPDDAHVERVAQEIITKLAEPFRLGDEMIYISASIGITLYPDDANEANALLRNADQAMYAAKNHGRNRFSYFTPGLEEAAQKRLHLIGDLRNALAENQFRLYFQPIVDLSDGSIRKAEALLRWHHPERGLVSPMEFIPLAEETGLINEIGNWVFMEAARRLSSWRDICGDDFQVSINKSPVQFMSETNVMEISWFNYLRELGLEGRNFVIEITEGLLLKGEEGVMGKLLALRDAGVQVAIDDFGTGYSALSYIKKFDIDYLKIDKSFVKNIESDPNDMALCEAIIVMAHKLGLKVVAEGVETEGQYKLLMAFDCDYAQGYLLAKPMPPEEFEKMFGSRLLN